MLHKWSIIEKKTQLQHLSVQHEQSWDNIKLFIKPKIYVKLLLMNSFVT